MTKSTKLLSRNGWKCPKFKIFLGKHQTVKFWLWTKINFLRKYSCNYGNQLKILQIGRICTKCFCEPRTKQISDLLIWQKLFLTARSLASVIDFLWKCLTFLHIFRKEKILPAENNAFQSGGNVCKPRLVLGTFAPHS